MKIVTGIKPKMVQCPTCKGAGKQRIESTTISPGKPVEKRVTEIICIDCNGKKKITPAQQRALSQIQSLWCTCKNPINSDVTFHDDGECGDCNKHHYHCGDCQKICQVG